MQSIDFAGKPLDYHEIADAIHGPLRMHHIDFVDSACSVVGQRGQTLHVLPLQQDSQKKHCQCYLFCPTASSCGKYEHYIL